MHFLNCYQNYIKFMVSENNSLELNKVKIKWSENCAADLNNNGFK